MCIRARHSVLLQIACPGEGRCYIVGVGSSLTTADGGHTWVNATTGAIVLKTPLSAGSNAPVAVDGDYVIAGAGTPLSAKQHPMLIAYKLGATGKLSTTVSP